MHPRLSFVTLLFIAMSGLSARAPADWLDHSELPDWARRGYCRWGHGANIDGRIKWTPNGYGLDVPNVELLLYCGRNLQQTIGYLDPEARRLGEGAGIKRQPYICSKTIWWRSEFLKAPQLEDCTILKPDGSRVLLYSNPERYGGCYRNAIWLEYVKGRIDGLMANQEPGEVHSIFFDNCMNYDCHCPVCREQFKAYTQERFGEQMDLSRPQDFPNIRFAKYLFDADGAVEFFQQIKAYLDDKHGEDILISPNISVGYGWSSYLVNRGATELVFCEEGASFPPHQSTVLKYKAGLAVSHGMTVGQLLGLPNPLNRTRALALDERNEGGILESFVYPEEHQLALAEALACDGTCVVSFALREQKITANDAPYQVQNRDAIHAYSEFGRQHGAWYDLAQPGARVAVVHSTISSLADRAHWKSCARVCELLGSGGIPYEVLCEDDLTLEQLAGYELLLVPHVPQMAVEDARVIAAWVAGGGLLAVTGNAATTDELNRPYPEGAAPEWTRVAPGEPQRIGEGLVWRTELRTDYLPPDSLAAGVLQHFGPLECRVSTASPKLFANILRSADGSVRTVHLINSDYVYEMPPSADIKDDDGSPEARSFFANTRWRARKVLLVDDPARAQGMALKFFGRTCGIATDGFAMVVSLNGQDIATLKGSELNQAGWFSVPVPEGLIRQTNEVVFRATGSPNGHPDWFALGVDTHAQTRRSSWSTDEGATYTEEDLGEDPGAQTGEFTVRFGQPEAPDAVAKPEDFMGRLHVRPAADVDVMIRADGQMPVAVLYSPDGPQMTIAPTVADGYATYRVPRVYIYSVLEVPTP